jgi:pimeloyl-ACP methyl ester carboxylesterase
MLNARRICRPADRAPSERFRPNRKLSAILLAGSVLATTGAGAEIFKKEDLLRGITITRAQCDATEQTFWLSLYGHDYCVRYYLSTAGGEGKRPVVFLQGDQLGKFNTKTWTWTDTAEAKDVDTADIMAMADGFSKETKTTAIYLARIGVDGTSGNHMSRKSVLELDLMNAALDALKQRYGFEGFHLAGQSGGSKIVAGLIGLRRDVACAVIGSGPLVAPDSRKSGDPGRNAFDTTENIAQVAQNRELRPILVTDKADKTVPLPQQVGYADRLRKAGRPVPELFVEAPETTDDKHHGVVIYTQLITAGCVLGRSDDEIARAVGTLIKRNVDYNQQRHKEAGAKASILSAARQPAADAAVAASGKK